MQTDIEIIKELTMLNKAAKKAPWYPLGSKSKDKAVYRISQAEEQLIISMRNNLGRLLELASR